MAPNRGPSATPPPAPDPKAEAAAKASNQAAWGALSTSMGQTGTPAPYGGRSYHQPVPAPTPDKADKAPTKTPIGVPVGHAAVVATGQPAGHTAGGLGGRSQWPGGTPSNPNVNTASGLVPAQYFQGDEWTVPAGLSKEMIASMQVAMQDAGIISPTAKLPYGSWDSTTASAFKDILAQANYTGLDWQTQYQHTITDAISMTGGGTGYLNEEGIPYSELPPEPVMPSGYLTNADELRSMASQVARQTIGRDVSNEFLDAFVNNFQAMESAFTEATVMNGQIVPEQLPSAETAARNAIEGDYGNEAEAMSMARVFDQFQQIIKGPFG